MRRRGLRLLATVALSLSATLLSPSLPLLISGESEGLSSNHAVLTGSSSFLESLESSTFHSLTIQSTHAHDPTHFTQGFTIDNDPALSNHDSIIELYEGTGVWGGTYIHKYTLPLSSDPATATLQLQTSVKLPNNIFGEGICIFNNQLLQLTYQNKCFFQYQKSLFDNTSLKPVRVKSVRATPNDYRKFPYPDSGISLLEEDFAASAAEQQAKGKNQVYHHFPGWKEGWGAAYNSHTQKVIVSDGTSTLYLLSPSELHNVESTLTVHYINEHGKRIEVNNINEMEYVPHPNSTPQQDKGEILANYYESYCVLRIHPESGLILGVLQADPALFYTPPKQRGRHPSVEAMNGLAFHARSQKLFVTGKLWPSIFQVGVKEHTGAPANRHSAQGFNLDLARHCPRLHMDASDMAYWQKVLSETAARGAAAEGKKAPAPHTPTPSSTAAPPATWSSVPPQSTAMKQVEAKKQMRFQAKDKPSPAAMAFEHVTTARHFADEDLLTSQPSHAELSAETMQVLEDEEENASLLGKQLREDQFDLHAYVQTEMNRMSHEAHHESHAAEAAEVHPEIVDRARNMLSGDL